MPADLWDEAKRLFAEALPLTEPERERRLETACAGRPRLRAEVGSLLAAHERAGGLLETRARAQAALLDDGQLVGERLGPYLLQRVLGQGGMGIVFRARREDPPRDVAIKVVRLDVGDAGLVRRFELEGRVLARLDHAHIARLYDVGRTSDGRPYFVLELVEGRPIDQHCGLERLGLRERLGLFLKLCDAVAYAHGRLVVHRDIKPGNVLVASGATPKLLDFGIAHLLDDGWGQGATETGLRLMTPQYASPEQMRGEPASVATDVHALGLLLHLLLTGRSAFQLQSGAPHELVRVICLDDPPAPSADVLRPPAAAERFPPAESGRRLARMLLGDLDAIVARALRKEPQARYASVADLQADVRRYLDAEPVLARGGRVRYRAGKFLRRQRLPVTLAAALLLALVAGLLATLWQARAARAERARAERRFADVRRLATSFLFDFHDSIRDLPGSTRARELVVAKALEYLERLVQEAGSDAELKLELARAYQRVGTVQGVGGQANLGDSAAAAHSLERAWLLLGEARPRLGGRPEFALAQVEIATALGRVRGHLGQFEGLLPLWEEAEAAAAAVPQDSADVALFAARVRLLADLTIERERRGALDEAERTSRAQLQVALDMYARFAQDQRACSALGSTQRVLASIQIHLGRYEDAHRNALDAVATQRACQRPGDMSSARWLMHSLTGLAKVERDGDLEQADAAYAEALAIAEGLTRQDAANANAVRDLAGVLSNWCWHLDLAQRPASGRDVCAESLRLAERLADAHSASATMDVVAARYFAAWQLQIRGAPGDALRLYEQARAAAAQPALAGAGPVMRLVKAAIWAGMAQAHLDLGQARSAKDAARHALEELGELTTAARRDRDELELRLQVLSAWMRADLMPASAGKADTACAPLEEAQALAAGLRAMTSRLPRAPLVLSLFEELRARCGTGARRSSSR